MFSLRSTSLAILFATFLTRNLVISEDNAPIPPSDAAVDGWFDANVKPFKERKTNLDPQLVAAEAVPRMIKVSKTGGNFNTIADALKSIPPWTTKRVIIHIGPGEYLEKIKLPRTLPFVTFYGNAKNMPTITYNEASESATVIIEAEYFVAINIIFKNSSPKPTGKRLVGAQALAVKVSATKAAFYNCKFIGVQDTLWDDSGFHFFKDCYIEGTVDFIFGRGKSMYLSSEVHVVQDSTLSVVTTQGKDSPSEDVGFSFMHCKVTGSGSGAYLGRAWMPSSRVIFSYSNITSLVNPAERFNSIRSDREKTVVFGEYECTGPGANSPKRAKLAKKLSAAEVKPFLVLGWIQASKWLLPPPKY